MPALGHRRGRVRTEPEGASQRTLVLAADTTQEADTIRIDWTRLKASLGSTPGLLASYVVVLGLIAFWPTPVDRGASAFLLWLGRTIPVLSYARIEFSANVVLFLPLGVLVARMLPSRPWMAIVAGFLASICIELVQWIALPARTPSALDVLSNTLGAAIGCLATVWWHRGRSPVA